jgi:hypothetical protein
VITYRKINKYIYQKQLKDTCILQSRKYSILKHLNKRRHTIFPELGIFVVFHCTLQSSTSEIPDKNYSTNKP